MPDGLRISIGLAIMLFALGVASIRVRFLMDLLFRAKPEPGRIRNIPRRLGTELVEVMGQKKLLQWTVPGIMHAFTYWGFLVIQVTLIESIGEVFDHDFEIPLIPQWLANTIGAVEDLFFALVTLSLLGFFILRVKESPKRKGKKSRFYGSHLGAAYIVLLMIFNVVWTVAVARGARAALGTFPYEWSPLSEGIGKIMTNLGWSESTIDWVGSTALLLHLAIVFGFLILVLNSKHMHIFTSPLNVLFGRHPRALGALRPMEIDMENLTEDTVFGVGQAEDFTWKQVLDMYTCTECGRCSSVCPAWNTDKPLNPKFIITDSRDHVFEKAPYMLGKVWEMDPNDPDNPMNKSLVGDVHDPESIWSCTTCGACVYECPVDIEHVDHILDMRRNLVMMESAFPQEAGLMLRNLENSGNPWGASNSQRLDWMKGLEDHIPIVNGRMPADAEYLYWVGCAGSFDDRGQKSVRAFAELMLAAKVPFAVLGPQENCTGDPARRIGNEYLFQEMAKQNIEMLKQKGVRKIVASCPHCFNTMAKEYPQLEGTFEVIHHSQLLDRLVADGKLRLTAEIEKTVAYHDPCYLARHNDVLEEPRRAIAEIPLIQSEEPGRCKRGTFCCGAGGARMWMEEDTGKRVNVERTEELLGTQADVLATACPYCVIMLDDAAKALDGEGKGRPDVQVLDVAQLLRQSVDPEQLTFLRPKQPSA
jgi:Fe-S oxidoreductase